MEFLKIFILSLLGLTALILFVMALYSKSFFKTVFLNLLSGIGILLIINLTTKFTGVHIPINYYTVSFSGVLGLPAVLGILIINFIFL